MKLIPLGKTGDSAIVDDEDYEHLTQWRWTRKVTPSNVYATRFDYYERKRYYMHSVITGYKETDHIDTNGLNNQRSNLRNTTRAQNIQNSSTQLRSRSGYRGVSFSKSTAPARPWRARIKVNGASRVIGYYAIAEEAAEAWNMAALNAWGEYARLNEINEEVGGQ